MPIRADQLREKEDYQQLIVERLVKDNKYRERPNTAFRPGLAMDTDMLFEFLENTHEAIIPRELFMQVQEEMVRRANLETGTGKRRTYGGKYALSHHVYCAHCGDVFRRTVWFLKGKNVSVWRCVSRLERKKSGIDCPARFLNRTFMRRW